MAFTPVAVGVMLDAVNTTVSVALGVAAGNNGSYGVRVVNDSNKTLFITFGASTITSVADQGAAIKSGAPAEYFTIGNGVTHVAAVAVGGAATGKIHFQLGQGE